MKRVLVLFLTFCVLVAPLSAEAELSYKPYGEDEFPIWTMKLRRAESLFFGSMVLTLPLSVLAWNLMESAGWVQADGIQEFGWQLLIASGLSLGISTADWIIGEVTDAEAT